MKVKAEGLHFRRILSRLCSVLVLCTACGDGTELHTELEVSRMFKAEKKEYISHSFFA